MSTERVLCEQCSPTSVLCVEPPQHFERGWIQVVLVPVSAQKSLE